MTVKVISLANVDKSLIPLKIFLYLCISVSLYVSLSRCQENWSRLRIDLIFNFDIDFPILNFEVIILTLKCDLKKDDKYILIFILATNKLKLLLLFKQSLAVIKLATLTERSIMLEEL